MEWADSASPLAKVVVEQSEACLAVYREDPTRVEQDANNELRIAEGGYRDRQLYELVQNAVDAAREGGHRLEVRLADDTLYVANDGAPFDEQGVRAVMASDLSPKDDDRIGRFGIGFKSVRAISDGPVIHSRTASFAFDAPWAAATIRGAGFASPRYPVMRLARPIDPDPGSDAILAELMSWAATVVVLPLTRHRERVALEIRRFPEEFLLFSPHITQARFCYDDGPGGSHDRVLTCQSDGPRFEIRHGRTRRSFTVLRAMVRPTPAARADAGRLADREIVELMWAVPRPAPASLGLFWAYFPTEAQTTLAGIVNAPWKLSEDRTRLLPGAFNEQLLTEELPRLLARNMALLFDPAHPGAHLDLLPARGREARNWADEVVNQPIFDALRTRPSLPDFAGRLRLPSELRMLPDGLHADWVAEWRDCGFAPLDTWVHDDTNATPERRLKTRRLVGHDEWSSPTVAAWLESLTEDRSAEASAAAIRLAARIVRAPGASPEVVESVTSARIILLTDGSLVRPVRGRVFLRDQSGTDTAAEGTFVHDALVDLEGVREALAALGVSILDRRGELQRLLVQGPTTEADWKRVWALVRELPPETARELLTTELPAPTETSVKVQTADGRWRPIADVLLPGAIVPPDGRRDRGVLVDPRFHAPDLELLRELGAVSEPAWREGVPRESWRDAYEQAMTDLFIDAATGSKPKADSIVVEGATPPWPLALIERLSPEGQVLLTQHVLSRGVPRRWTVQHRTNRTYGTMPVIAPELWLLRRKGRLATPFGPLPPRRCVMPSDDLPDDALPVASELPSAAAIRLGVRETPADFTKDDWHTLKKIADTWLDDARRTEFYTWIPPEYRTDELVVRVGHKLESVAVENIGVTTSPVVYDGLLEARVPAMLVALEEDAARFIEHWGINDGKDLLREEIVAEEAGEPSYLVDEFPPLKLNPRLAVEDYELLLQPCTRLERLVSTPKGQVPRSIPAMRDGTRVLVTASKPAAVLRQVSEVLQLEMAPEDIDRVLRQMESARASELRARIRKAASHDPLAGLVEAVGLQELRQHVPAQALEAVEAPDEPAATDIAKLALAVHGIGILRVVRSALEERGLEPPREFSGRRREREWVTKLGLPVEWAGFPRRPVPSREVIDGPVTLPELHDYQKAVKERIRALLQGATDRERGVVSLPTGAGKTRVTVEALVEEVAAGRLGGPIVWIAQSDELCAQAAESWTYVWRAIGPAHPLVLSRLWGSNSVAEEPDGTQVVVATDAKLDSILQRSGDEYDWLRDPSVVVVDEAHTSVSPRYTRLFEWLGRSGRKRNERGRVIGLTATPFRGQSDEETERLVRRYDSNLLDVGVLGDNPYAELQSMGVLANVRRDVLRGAHIEFSEAQRAEIEETNRFPDEVAANLGRDQGRTNRIIDSILSLPPGWPVLLFAPTVENARTIAALLAFRGVPAVAVSASTEAQVRRHYIDEFRKGSIRVLTNYGVLTQGFDAPAVRAVYVCRPTFSPNVYQQMVGRGLRGPKNGGAEEVLIVDVEDNLNVFGERLAFREFERLWRE
jgi:superfamily II DNA or RNA helicase